MRQILLLRHAKSSWDDPELRDFDRPLAKRGKEDAPRMGRFIRSSGYKPAQICSSTARRAKQTAELFCESAQVDASGIYWNEELYYGGVNDYLDCIREASDGHERVMLIGHNPKIEDLATLLCGGEGKVAFRVPTAGLLCFESFVNKWSDVGASTCQLKWMMIPKVLKKIID